MQLLHKGGETTVTVYLDRDNTVQLKLMDAGVASATTSITSMKLIIGDVLVSSTNIAANHIRWNQSGYETGEIRLQLGHEELEAGRYHRCFLIPYTATNTQGEVWGTLQLFVLDTEEPT